MKELERPTAEKTLLEVEEDGLPARRLVGERAGERPGERPGEIVTSVLAGDVESFRGLVEAHERAVHGLCRKLLHGDAAEAEDLTQETFFRAYQHLSRLEDRDRFAPWLYQIARSFCRDRNRRREVERRALMERAEELRSRAGTGCRPGEALPADPESSGSAVLQALADLPEEERTALTLKYHDGLSYDEIASRLDLSFSRVDHLIRKARSRLARRLAVRDRVETR